MFFSTYTVDLIKNHNEDFINLEFFTITNGVCKVYGYLCKIYTIGMVLKAYNSSKTLGGIYLSKLPRVRTILYTEQNR